MGAYAILDNEQLISHTRMLLLIPLPLQDSDRVVIPVAEVHELLRFMILWIMLYLSGLAIHLIF